MVRGLLVPVLELMLAVWYLRTATQIPSQRESEELKTQN